MTTCCEVLLFDVPASVLISPANASVVTEVLGLPEASNATLQVALEVASMQ